MAGEQGSSFRVHWENEEELFDVSTGSRQWPGVDRKGRCMDFYECELPSKAVLEKAHTLTTSKCLKQVAISTHSSARIHFDQRS